MLAKCSKCAAELGEDDLSCKKCGAVVRQQRRLGEILIDERIISRDHLEEALRLQKRRLGEILVEIGACKPTDLERAIELQRLGRTRADIYRRWLRVALAVILLLVVALAGALWKLENDSNLQLRIEKESLSFEEVARILDDPVSSHKFDALRSLTRQVKDPRAVEIIGRALRNEKWYVQLYACILARDSGAKSLVGPLIHLLVDAKKVVGPLAHQALQSITGQQIGPSVKSWREWAQANGLSVEGN